MRPVTFALTSTKAAARKLPIHQRIVWARKRKGISQETLALTIGTSRRHMIRIEKGLHQPGAVFRSRIAEATDQPEDFFDVDDEESDLSVDLDLMLRSYLRKLIREEVRA